MEIIKQQFTYPDKKGGHNVYYFETSADQVIGDDNKKLPETIVEIKTEIIETTNNLQTEIIEKSNNLQTALNNESVLRETEVVNLQTEIIETTNNLQTEIIETTNNLQTEIIETLPTQKTLTVSKSGWQLNSSETSEYVYYNDVTVTGLKATDVGWIDFSLSTYSYVLEAGIAMKAQSFAGKVRLYAIEVPTSDIEITFTYFKGRE